MLGRLVALPIDALLWLLEELRDRAEQELYDEGKIRQELIQLESAFESGRISREDFDAGERALIERLREARNRRLEQSGE